MIYWEEITDDFTPFAPEKLCLSYGVSESDSPFNTKNFFQITQAIRSGYEPKPSDCPPIRLTSKYGFSIRCPGNATVEMNESFSHEKIENHDSVIYGYTKITGDKTSHSDSGYIVSWIKGSRYVKIITGIKIYFPTDYYLYQSAPPNFELIEGYNPTLCVMTGIEYPHMKRRVTINNVEYSSTDLVLVVKAKGSSLTVTKGELLGVFYLVPDISKQKLQKLNEI